MYKKILKIIEEEFDLENLKRLSLQIYPWERSFSYKNFSKSAGYCFNQFKGVGLSKVKRISLPADGVTTYLDFTMPEAWDIEDAILEIVEPEVSEKILVNHRDEALGIANRCAPTPEGGLTAEVITEEQMNQATEIKRKIVFTRFSHPKQIDKQISKEVSKKGGIGIISCYSPAYLDAPDGTYWINGWGSPGWYHTKADKKLLCFSLTPRRGEYLAKLLRGNTVKVKAEVKSKIYDGSIYSITGILPGEKQEEILLLAHIYEPFINDNATGAASLIEIGRILNTLMAGRELPSLKRNIRFLISQERYGFAHFFQDKKRREKILCGVNMDTISLDYRKTGFPIQVRTSPVSLPFFGDLLLQDIVDYYLPPYPYEIEKGSLSDDTFISDRTIGIPTNWVWTPPGKWHHNSADSFDRLTDWNIARKIIVLITAYVYFLATADKKEIPWLKNLILRNIKISRQRESKRLADALSEKQTDYQEAIEKLKFFSQWQKGQVLSLRRYYPHGKIEGLQAELKRMVKEEEKNLSLLKNNNNINKALSRKEKVAQNIVLERKAVCFPFSLAKIPAAEKIDHPQGVEQILNWVNGKRDLLEILRLFKYETGKALKEKEISYLIKYCSLLDKYGYLRIRYKTELTKEDIEKGLRKLGLKKGDRIIVHCSLSGLGYVKGGAKTVCHALMELITKEGVLMMPSFNHYTPFKKGEADYYSPKETPTTDGKVPDTFWRMRGVRRSLNPSHAFAVWGKEAESYLKNHHKLLTMGEGSPLHLLEKAGGKVVLIDCPTASTFHHVVEMTNDVPCLGKRTEEYPAKLPDGKMVKCRTWGWRNAACPISDKSIYLKAMKKRSLIKEGKIGKAPVLVFEMKDCRKIIEEFLKGRIRNFLGCKSCNIRPRTVPATVKSDWDTKNKRARAGATSFIGDIPS